MKGRTRCLEPRDRHRPHRLRGTRRLRSRRRPRCVCPTSTPIGRRLRCWWTPLLHPGCIGCTLRWARQERALVGRLSWTRRSRGSLTTRPRPARTTRADHQGTLPRGTHGCLGSQILRLLEFGGLNFIFSVRSVPSCFYQGCSSVGRPGLPGDVREPGGYGVHIRSEL